MLKIAATLLLLSSSEDSTENYRVFSVLECAVLAHHASRERVREQTMQRLYDYAYSTLLEAYENEEMSQEAVGEGEHWASDTPFQNAQPAFWVGMLFAQELQRVEARLSDRYPFGDGLGSDVVMGYRALSADIEYREKNCDYVLP